MLACIFDVSNLAHRYDYVLQSLSNDEMKTGILFGITKLLISICRNEKPEIISFVFDPMHKSKNFQSERPLHYLQQYEALQEMLDILKINYVVAEDGNEADQMIASFVRLLRVYFGIQNILQIKIYSNDHDYWQLIDEDLVCVTSGSGNENYRIIDKDFIFKTYGVEPHQLLDLFSLTGDKSDNIEGIKGIGPKKAAKLVKEHESLLGVLTSFAADGKYVGEWQTAMEGYHKMNLLDCYIPFSNKYPVICEHMYEREFLWFNDLKEFFKRFQFEKFLNMMMDHHLFTGNPSFQKYKLGG